MIPVAILSSCLLPPSHLHIYKHCWDICQYNPLTRVLNKREGELYQVHYVTDIVSFLNCSPAFPFPEVAQLDEIWLHMQTLSPNCNLIFCSAGQRDQHLSSHLPRLLHHSYVYNCHQDVACQQDSCVQSSPSLHSHSGNKPIISSCFHDG